MDELDLLKKDWKKQDAKFPILSYEEIYKMIHKKSSSIVKWILIISVAELLFWSLLNFLIPEKYLEIYEKFHLKTFLYVVQVIHYVVILIFIYFFYKNYKAISVFENTNRLMRKIINTRKTVNFYMYYNIGLYILLSLIVNIIMFSHPDIMVEALNPKIDNIDKSQFLTIMLITQVIALFIFIGLFWLYYRLIYGILLKKLSKNYIELKRLN